MRDRKNKDEEFRASTATIKKYIDRWDACCERAFRRFIRNLEHEAKMEVLDGRRDW